jgi:hypothetical protein
MGALSKALALLMTAAAAGGAVAQDAPSVRVLATDPPGDVVTLGRNQNFYLLLDYRLAQPAHLWVRPYFEGEEVIAGSNPSNTYEGSGRALGWFFLMQPGDRVDEIRIRAGDGTSSGTHDVATYPVQVTGGDQPAAAHAAPAWVAELRARDQAVQRAAYEQQMRTPPAAGDVALFGGFMLLMLALGILGMAGPAWGVWRWHGAWRLAAAVPAAGMAFVVLRVMADTARDPTSHNLWPFEILQAGALSCVVMALLFAMRRIGAARR